jgi:hypothetical protein
MQQRDRMSGQLDEVFRLRQNETENLLHDQKAQYEARLKGMALILLIELLSCII